MSELRDTYRLGRIAIVVSWIWLASDGMFALGELYTIHVLGGFGSPVAPLSDLQMADFVTMVTAAAYTLAIIATGIIVLRWIHQASSNAHVLSRASMAMTMSPGWTVGFFFVPIMSLWKPFRGVRETWQASENPEDPMAVPVPAVLRWWWGAWITMTILSNISIRLSLDADTSEKLIAVSWFGVVAFPVDVVLTITLTRIIDRVIRMQRTRIEEASAGTDHSPRGEQYAPA